MSKGLNELRDIATATATKSGFTEASPLECIALIHTELSEAVEDIRNGNEIDEMWYEEKGSALKWRAAFDPTGKSRKPAGVPSEIADVIIRCLHFAGQFGIDIERAVDEKMAHNATRSFKHGKVI